MELGGFTALWIFATLWTSLQVVDSRPTQKSCESVLWYFPEYCDIPCISSKDATCDQVSNKETSVELVYEVCPDCGYDVNTQEDQSQKLTPRSQISTITSTHPNSRHMTTSATTESTTKPTATSLASTTTRLSMIGTRSGTPIIQFKTNKENSSSVTLKSPNTSTAKEESVTSSIHFPSDGNDSTKSTSTSDTDEQTSNINVDPSTVENNDSSDVMTILSLGTTIIVIEAAATSGSTDVVTYLSEAQDVTEPSLVPVYMEDTIKEKAPEFSNETSYTNTETSIQNETNELNIIATEEVTPSYSSSTITPSSADDWSSATGVPTEIITSSINEKSNMQEPTRTFNTHEEDSLLYTNFPPESGDSTMSSPTEMISDSPSENRETTQPQINVQTETTTKSNMIPLDSTNESPYMLSNDEEAQTTHSEQEMASNSPTSEEQESNTNAVATNSSEIIPSDSTKLDDVGTTRAYEENKSDSFLSEERASDTNTIATGNSEINPPDSANELSSAPSKVETVDTTESKQEIISDSSSREPGNDTNTAETGTIAVDYSNEGTGINNEDSVATTSSSDTDTQTSSSKQELPDADNEIPKDEIPSKQFPSSSTTVLMDFANYQLMNTVPPELAETMLVTKSMETEQLPFGNVSDMRCTEEPKTFRRKIVKVFRQRAKSWQHSKRVCEKNGLRLMSVQNDDDITTIRASLKSKQLSVMNNSFDVGGFRLANQQDYCWLEGGLIKQNIEPANLDKSKDVCLSLKFDSDTEAVKYIQDYCGDENNLEHLYFLCELYV